MSEAKACKCDHCGTVERLVSPQTHPTGWILVFGWKDGRLDFCSPGHLIAWAATPAVDASLDPYAALRPPNPARRSG